MAIYLIDDLIEFLGENYLSSQWDFFFKNLINQVNKEDCVILQSASIWIRNYYSIYKWLFKICGRINKKFRKKSLLYA